jgi:hypothetical protein
MFQLCSMQVVNSRIRLELKVALQNQLKHSQAFLSCFKPQELTKTSLLADSQPMESSSREQFALLNKQLLTSQTYGLVHNRTLTLRPLYKNGLGQTTPAILTKLSVEFLVSLQAIVISGNRWNHKSVFTGMMRKSSLLWIKWLTGPLLRLIIKIMVMFLGPYSKSDRNLKNRFTVKMDVQHAAVIWGNTSVQIHLLSLTHNQSSKWTDLPSVRAFFNNFSV